MHTIDVALIVLTGGLALWGGFKGLVRLVLLFGGMAGGMILAQLYYPVVARFLAGLIESDWLRDLAAFAAIFLCVQLAAHLAGRLVRRLLHVTATAWLDRLAGVLAGLSLALVIIQGVRLLVQMIPLPMDAYFEGSRLWPLVLSIIDRILAFRNG